MNGELACGKETTWEGGHRVPTIIRWPSVIPGNTVNQELLSSLDWFPTLSKLFGVPLVDGVVYVARIPALGFEFWGVESVVAFAKRCCVVSERFSPQLLR